MFTLHELELGLIDYLAGTVRGYVLWGPHSRGLKVALQDQLSHEPALLDFFVSAEGEPRQLNDQELAELHQALETAPFIASIPWVPWPLAHGLYIRVLPSLRRTASKATAERFADLSVRCVATLEREDLALLEGLDALAEWIAEVRRLKRATALGEQTERSTDHALKSPVGDTGRPERFKAIVGVSTPPTQPKQWLSVDAIRKRARRRREAVLSDMDKGLLPYEQRGRNRYARLSDVEAWEGSLTTMRPPAMRASVLPRLRQFA